MSGIVITILVMLVLFGLYVAATQGERDSFSIYWPSPLGCLLVLASLLALMAMGIFYLGQRYHG